MDKVVRWSELVELIQPFYSKRRDLRDYSAETMLRIYLMQDWFSLDEKGMEEALVELPVIREFAHGFSVISPSKDPRIPKANAISTFCRFLEKHGLGERISEVIKTKPISVPIPKPNPTIWEFLKKQWDNLNDSLRGLPKLGQSFWRQVQDFLKNGKLPYRSLLIP